MARKHVNDDKGMENSQRFSWHIYTGQQSVMSTCLILLSKLAGKVDFTEVIEIITF